MKLDRRNFIQLVVGGAIGINLTPLPWKLTDDSAIWTQNWSWVPSPARGDFTEAKSICTLCPGGCGIQVRKAGPRAVKIEGRRDYPINPGGTCPLGEGGLQLLYDESIRFTGPMKRVGPRGEGVFQDITWEEALTTLAGRISTLREQGRPEAIAAVDGNRIDSTMSVMVKRLMDAIGSPNYERTPTDEDTYRMANALMQGTDGPVAYDLESADFVLSFDAGLLEGWGAPGRVVNAWGMWHEGNPKKRKVKIVQVESRASNTASKADQWVAARPGTEGALALGLAHVIIKQGLYNADFVNNYSAGFEDWVSADGRPRMGFKSLVLKKYAPAQTAKITGVDEKRIVSLAQDFARAKAPLALCGKGKGYLNGSLYGCMAVQSLNALVGTINKRGGVLVYDPLPLAPLPPVQLDNAAQQGLAKARLDQAGTSRYPFSTSLVNNFAEAILAKEDSPVDTLLVFASNPAYTLPDAGAFHEALRKIPFIVSFSPYQDETAYMADLILPDHAFLEKTDDVVWPIGLQYPFYGLTQPVVEPLYDTRNSGDAVIQLAKKTGGSVAASFPWKTYKEVLRTRVKGLYDACPGKTCHDHKVAGWERLGEGREVKCDYKSFKEMWKTLESGGFWYRPACTLKEREKTFKTPSGKFEFQSAQIEAAVNRLAEQSSDAAAREAMGIGAEGEEAFMAHYEPAHQKVDRGEYPLVMVPYGIISHASGWTPNPPFLNKTLSPHLLRKEKSFALVHPKTAAEHRLQEGDWVDVESPAGKVRVGVTLFEGAMPGVVYLLQGLGHTAYDEFSRRKGVNPNRAVLASKDPLTGHPVWWETPVKLMKA